MSSSFSDVLANVFSFSMSELSRHSCVLLSLKNTITGKRDSVTTFNTLQIETQTTRQPAAQYQCVLQAIWSRSWLCFGVLSQLNNLQ